jgi:hypothetical protein
MERKRPRRVRMARAFASLVLVLAGAGPVSSALRAAPLAIVEEPESEEPNRAYLGWAPFQPGAWVAEKSAGTPDETRNVLKSVTPSEAVIEISRVIPGVGLLPTKTLRIPARIKKAARGDVHVNISEEVLTINGKRVRCRVERGPFVSIWRAPEIPGGVARSETPFTSSWVVAWGEKP